MQEDRCVSIEDCKVLKRFMLTFDASSTDLIDMLSSVIERRSNLSMKRVHVKVCRWFASSSCDILKDDIWDELKINSTKEAYDLEFDMDVEELLKESS